jgi:hypothetical protein
MVGVTFHVNKTDFDLTFTQIMGYLGIESRNDNPPANT